MGVVADRRPYRGAGWYEFRETAATLVALWDVIRREPPADWECEPATAAEAYARLREILAEPELAGITYQQHDCQRCHVGVTGRRCPAAASG